MGTVSGAANAALSQCSSGNLCLWLSNDYSGGFDQSTGYIILGAVYNNQTDSVASYGNVNCAQFFDRQDLTGENIYFSRPGRGGTYRDPNLGNGGGYGSTAHLPWNHKIGSANWRTCPF
ncbi:hypothetical protein GXB85_13090 [Cellulomonas sp. APG4]|nr:hypothetical protein [Cellulomonas sp. APG4]